MRTDLDPSEMTHDERRREVAAILAAGLCRLRDRHALDSRPVMALKKTLQNPAKLALKLLAETRSLSKLVNGSETPERTDYERERRSGGR